MLCFTLVMLLQAHYLANKKSISCFHAYMCTPQELGLEDEASLISNPGIGTAAEWDTARPLGSRGLLRPGGDGSSNDTASTNSTGSGGGGGAGEGGGGGGGAQAPGVRDWRDVLLAWESRGGGAGIGGLDASTPGECMHVRVLCLCACFPC